MLDHHLQRGIVYKLAFAPSLRFSELKPDGVENKLFTYHLKKVVSAGYVGKATDGTYTLTPEGRRVGVRILDNQHAVADKAESVLFLVIRRESDDAWLLYKRATHPLIGRVGFMHAVPNAAEACTATASRECQERTGLAGEFRALGSGFFRVYDSENLESFTHFTLMVCDDAHGNLVEADKHAEYEWYANPDFSSPDLLPNMAILAELYKTNQPFFVEKKLQV